MEIPAAGQPPPPKIRSQVRGFCALCGIGFLGFLSWIFLSIVAHRGRTPPEGMATVEEFRRTLDADGSHSYETFRWRDKTYLEARKLTPLWTLPSGSTCYVFDDRGQFLDWIWDNGESNTWDVNWGQTGRTAIEWKEIQERFHQDVHPPAERR